jgi:hypothetical protein
VVGLTGSVIAPLAFTAWYEDRTELVFQRGKVYERREFVPADPYLLMVEHFTECVIKEKPLLYPPEDSQATLLVLDTLRSSSPAKLG